jgi:hypothetical protein
MCEKLFAVVGFGGICWGAGYYGAAAFHWMYAIATGRCFPICSDLKAISEATVVCETCGREFKV